MYTNTAAPCGVISPLEPLDQEFKLEELFSTFDFEKLSLFVPVLKSYFDAAKTQADKEMIIRSIDKVEKKIAEKQAPNNRKTLLSEIIDQFPDFALTAIPFFKSSFDVKIAGNNTALMKACKKKRVDIAKALIVNGADLNAVNALNQTALGVCLVSIREITSQFLNVSAEDKQLFDALVEGGCDVNSRVDMLNNSATLWCSMMRQLSDWTWKLLPYAEVNRKNNLGWQLIHRAVATKNKQMVSELIQRKAELNGLAKEGVVQTRSITPCHIAVLADAPEILQILIQAGADPYKRAVNPFFPRADDAEPLTTFLMAVDLKRQACLEVIVRLCPPRESDYNPGYERSSLTIPYERIRDLKGYSSLPLVAEGAVCKTTSSCFEIGGVKCYVGDSNKQAFVLWLFENYFTHSPYKEDAFFYQPIWKMISTFAKHNSQFSIIFSNEIGQEGTCGSYNADTETEIFIYPKKQNWDAVSLGGTLVHEMTHKCSHLVYRSLRLAPLNSDSPFYTAIKTDLATLPDNKEKFAFVIQDLFQVVSKHYKEKQHPAEYLARLPQAVFLLTHEYKLSSSQVTQIMQNCLPNLFAFYRDDFLPACEKYAANQTT